MSEINTLLQQEIALGNYKQLRNAPRDTINYGVRPNAIKCLAEYEKLQIALSGGDIDRGIPDISDITAQFAVVTGPVTPFIILLQVAMQIIIQTPQIVDQLAAAQGMIVAPFGVDISEALDPGDYAQMLADAVTTIVSTLEIMQTFN